MANPFAAASALPQPDSSDASEPAEVAAAPAAGTAASAAAVEQPAASEAAGPSAAAAAPAGGAAPVDKAAGKLGADGKGLVREGSGKRQAMSHPVEVPEELT